MGGASQGNGGVPSTHFSLGGMTIFCPHLDHTKGMSYNLYFDTLQISHMQGNHGCSKCKCPLGEIFETLLALSHQLLIPMSTSVPTPQQMAKVDILIFSFLIDNFLSINDANSTKKCLVVN
jgi:hypothetical protein